MEIKVGPMTFRSAGPAISFFSALLAEHEGKIFEGEERIVVEALLRRHPDADFIFGGKVNAISSRRFDWIVSPQIHVLREDGQEFEIGFQECVDGRRYARAGKPSYVAEDNAGSG